MTPSDTPDPVMPTTLSGTLSKISLYRHPLLIGTVVTHGHEVPIIGNVTTPPGRGSKIDLNGKYKEHKDYGLQFAFTSLIEHLPDKTDQKGITRFLMDKCDGVGIKKAEKLYQLYGEETLQKLAADPTLFTTHLKLSPDAAEENSTILRNLLVSDKIRIPLLSWGFSPAIIDRVNEVFKDQAEQIISADPYQLICIKGIGFETLDKILTSRRIVEPNSEQRGMALCYHIIKEEVNQKGNTIIPLNVLLTTIKEFKLDTPISLEAVLLGINYGVRNAILSDVGNGNYTLPDIALCERCIAAELMDLADISKHPLVPSIATGLCTKEWEKEDPAPNALQIQAVQEVAKNKISIITGGPGTGKTFTLKGLIRSLPKGLKIALMAPTGKAAKRMSESLRGLHVTPPTTIHKFLRQRPDEVDSSNIKSSYTTTSTTSSFERKRITPDLIIVDELSMVDIHLFDHLLKYIGKTPHLVLIGDVDQLPSIGPGLILADLINSGKFTTTRLLKNERQVEGSAILTNAYNVLSGNSVTPTTGSDWQLTLSDHASDLVRPILDAVTYYKNKGYDPIKHIQILCPQHRGTTGTSTLNALVRELINPKSPTKPEYLDKDGTSLFRLGDKVVSTKNHHLPNANTHGEKEVYVVNGDTGVITDLTLLQTPTGITTKIDMTVDFETHQAKYIYDKSRKGAVNTLDMLQQAWAMSVHKSQGSEYPVVIISLTNEVFMDLLNRPLLYTAITRGKEVVHLFASQKSIFKAITNTTPSKRTTNLLALLKTC